MFLLLKYLITSLTLFVYFLKHNGVTCFSFRHYFIYSFGNLSMFIIQIMPFVINTVYDIIIHLIYIHNFLCNWPNFFLCHIFILYCIFIFNCFYFRCSIFTKFTLKFIFYLSFNCLIHHYLVHFFIQFHSSSHLMMTGFSLLYQETPAGRRTFPLKF